MLSSQVLVLLVFVLWEAYFKEKGKNLATKEDIGGITQEIESVKNVYENSLARYKIELQKEFESSRYMIEFVNKLDRNLLELLIKTNNDLDEWKHKIGDPEILPHLDNIANLYSFLKQYEIRYSTNKDAKDVIKFSGKLMENIENHPNDSSYCHSFVDGLYESCHNLLTYFLPKLPGQVAV